jgi:hypothetical protein
VTDQSEAARNTPRVDRPAIPAEYGVGGATEYVAWSHVEERLTSDRVVWLATVSASGRPRLRPVDALYVDGSLWVGGSPLTAWVRDLAQRTAVAVHLDGVDDVVIVEGEAEVLTSISADQAERLGAASMAKFPEYRMTAANYRSGAIRIQIQKVIAWTSFAKDPTRFRLEDQPA